MTTAVLQTLPAILRSRWTVLTLLLIAICTLTWQTRHHWIPPLGNLGLNGAKIEQLSGVNFSPAQKGNIDVQSMRLRLDSGIQVEIKAAQLRGLTSLLGGNSAQTPLIINIGQVRLRNLSSADSNAEESPPDQKRHHSAPESAPTPITKPSTGGVQSAPLRLSELLQRFKKLPRADLRIRQLTIPELSSTPMQLNIQSGDGKLESQLHSNRCRDCGLELQLTTGLESDRQSALSATLRSQGAEAATLQLTSRPHRSTSSQTPINRPDAHLAEPRWRIQSDLNVNVIAIQALLRQLGVQPPVPELEAYQAKGSIRLQSSAEVPDEIMQMQRYKAFDTELHTDALQFMLPPAIAGAPMVARVRSTSALRWSLATLQPLQADTVSGTLALELDTLPAASGRAGERKGTEGSDAPLLDATLELSRESGQPRADLSGALQLARAYPLLAVDRWQTALAPYNIRDLEGQIRFEGNIDLPLLADWQSPDAFNPIGRNLRFEIKPGGKITAKVDLPDKNNPLQVIGWSQAHVAATIEKSAVFSTEQWSTPTTLTADSVQLTVTGSGKDAKATFPPIRSAITDIHCEDIFSNHCTAALESETGELQLTDSKTRAESVGISLNLRTSPMRTTAPPKERHWQISNMNLTAKKVLSGAIGIQDAEFFAPALECKRSTDRTSCTSDQLAIAVSPLSMMDSRIEGVLFLDQFSLTTVPDAEPGSLPEITTRYRAHNLVMTAMDTYTVRLDPTGEATLKQGVLEGKSTVKAGNIQLESQWQHNSESGSGQLAFTLPSTGFSPQQSLSTVIAGIPADIVEGRMAASGKIHWPAQSRDHVEFSLQEAAATYGDIVAVGIDGNIRLNRNNNGWQTSEPAPIRVQRVDTGVAVNNLHFTLALSPQRDIVLDGFAAELLDGVLTASTLRWNLDGAPRVSQVNFTGLSLRKLAEEMEAENFSASGLVDAKIPLEVDRQGITVEDGTVQSRPGGGRLRYYGAFSPQMLTANPQLKMIAGALEDYEYRELKGTFTYPLSGDLTLNLKLTGRSDAVDANRDLVINLNLENNIPQMLRSLQASRNLQDVLENQVP